MNQPEDKERREKRDTKDDDFGTTNTIHRLLSFFGHQNDILKRASHRILQMDIGDFRVLSPLLCRIDSSSGSLFILANINKAGDCYILARSIFETIVNACFICAKGKEAAQRARRHALQKTHRDLDRKVAINDRVMHSRWMGLEDITISHELKNALAEFTNKKGKEIIPWAPESVKEKIRAIDTKYGGVVATALHCSFFSIYRYASDITHGTFYGAMYWLGMTKPSRTHTDDSDIPTYLRKMNCLLLITLTLSIHALISVLNREFSLPDLWDESRTVADELNQEPWNNRNE